MKIFNGAFVVSLAIWISWLNSINLNFSPLNYQIVYREIRTLKQRKWSWRKNHGDRQIAENHLGDVGFYGDLMNSSWSCAAEQHVISSSLW